MASPTDQQAYGLLVGTYGHIGALDFAYALTDGRGHANLLACELLEWILDWYRPKKDGLPRFRGRLYLPSADLAQRWNVTERTFKDARMCLSRSGLVSIHSAQHKAWIEVHWDAVAAALAAHKAIIDDLDGRKNVRLDSDGRKNVRLDVSDGRKNVRLSRQTDGKTSTYFSYESTSKTSSPSDGPAIAPAEAGQREEGGSEREKNKRPQQPSLPSSPPLGREALGNPLTERVEAMLKRGRDAGRPCTGPWVTAAHEAVSEAVERGESIEDIDRAWRYYLQDVSNTSRSKDASSATDLAHWLRDLRLDGKPGRGYSATIAELRRLDEVRRREREAAAEAERQAEEAERRRQDPAARRQSALTMISAVCGQLGREMPSDLDGKSVEELLALNTTLSRELFHQGRP